MKPIKTAIFLLPLAALAMLACGGCVRSEQPLSAARDARADPRLAGQWHADSKEHDEADPANFRVTFDAQGLGHMTAQKKADGPFEADPNLPELFVTTTPKASYLNCVVFDDDQKTPGASAAKHYEFYQYEVSADDKTLTLRLLNTKRFIQAVQDGKLKGSTDQKDKAVGEGSVLLTDSSEAILKFIEASPPAEVFGDPVTATKVPER